MSEPSSVRVPQWLERAISVEPTVHMERVDESEGTEAQVNEPLEVEYRSSRASRSPRESYDVEERVNFSESAVPLERAIGCRVSQGQRASHLR